MRNQQFVFDDQASAGAVAGGSSMNDTGGCDLKEFVGFLTQDEGSVLRTAAASVRVGQSFVKFQDAFVGCLTHADGRADGFTGDISEGTGSPHSKQAMAKGFSSEFLVADSIEELVAKIKELGERPGFAATLFLNTKRRLVML